MVLRKIVKSFISPPPKSRSKKRLEKIRRKQRSVCFMCGNSVLVPLDRNKQICANCGFVDVFF